MIRGLNLLLTMRVIFSGLSMWGSFKLDLNRLSCGCMENRFCGWEERWVLRHLKSSSKVRTGDVLVTDACHTKVAQAQWLKDTNLLSHNLRGQIQNGYAGIKSRYGPSCISAAASVEAPPCPLSPQPRVSSVFKSSRACVLPFAPLALSWLHSAHRGCGGNSPHLEIVFT